MNIRPYQDFDVGVDIPKFEGKMQPKDFIDWLRIVKRIFYFKKVSWWLKKESKFNGF